MRNSNTEIKKKHDHSLTNILKAGIFSLVMLAPIFSIAVRCGYVMFNKNAFESYSGQVNTEYTPLNNLDNFIIGKKYMFNNNFGTYTDSSQKNTGAIFYRDAKILSTYNTNAQNTINNGNNFTFYYNTNGISIYVKYNTTDIGNWTVTNQYSLSFEFILENYNSTLLSNNYSMIRSIDETNESYLDNAFTYGLSNLKNESVFNWTQNTAIYTPIHAMCTGLGITEEAIAIMLTYWALMTAIYIIFDIVIVLFTKLTHLLN